MDKKVERLTTLIKGRVEKRPTFGTDPNDPWSVKSNVNESGELDTYLKSKGIDPMRVSPETKISHAKSGSFAKWKQDRKFTEEVEQIDEDELLNAYLKTRGINPKTASKISKIAASKTGQFDKWKRDRMRGGRVPVPTHEQVSYKHSATMRRQKLLDRAYRKLKPIRIAGPDLHRGHHGPRNEEVDKKDTVTMDIPLLIRMLELAREDLKTDMDLHRVVEKLIDIRNKGILTMDDYDFVANIKEQFFPEDTYQDSYASTQTVGPEVTSTDDSDNCKCDKPCNCKKLSKAAKIVKELYKRKVQEDLYDHEKEDKSVATYGKKPKIDSSPIDPKAAGIIYGGKTMTNQERDTIELDPMMKRPNVQPDFAKKANIDKKTTNDK